MGGPASLPVLIVDDDVGDLMVFRRVLRETAYAVFTVRSASQALAALGTQSFAAVVADDERLPDMAGAVLLAEVERLQPRALRVLLARSERSGALLEQARAGRFRLIARPYFARPLCAALVEHAAHLAQAPAGAEPTQRAQNPFVEAPPDDTEPIELAPPARVAHRRILLTMVELVEAKVGYSSGHGARVSALAAALAREAGLSGEELERVQDAALVHDVGEFALDPLVLQREGGLSDLERRAVRGHVESSYQIVRRAGLPPALLEAVRHHHERFEGGGYPDGIAGARIPLASRMIAVVDTWDALATDRPYRRAASPDSCLRELVALGGNQLDPQLVSLFAERRIHELIDWTDPPRPGVKLA